MNANDVNDNEIRTREGLYKLLRIALGNEGDLVFPDDANFLEVMEASERLCMGGLAVSGFQKLVDSGVYVAPSEKAQKQRMMQWLGLSMMMEQNSKLQWEAAQQLVELYARHGITTVGLKGMTVAQWYPNPMYRPSCDFDCFLLAPKPPKGEFESDERRRTKDEGRDAVWEEGNRIVEREGVTVDRNIYVHSIYEYKGLVVENHHYLAAVKLSKRYRRLDEEFRRMLISEPLEPVSGSKLMTGSPMFNALFLTHHAHRHFLNEYMPMKLLCDWALFIQHNGDLDWQRYCEFVDRYGMLRFAQAMTRLACRLLGAGVPFALPEDDDADKLMEESIWDIPEGEQGGKSLFARRLDIISHLLHARKRYKVFYDISSLQMIVAYVKGYFFGETD